MHGTTSLWQTLGWNHPRWNGLLAATGPLLGVALAIGYLSIPTAVLAGAIALPAGVP
jgi:hypothetical protein